MSAKMLTPHYWSELERVWTENEPLCDYPELWYQLSESCTLCPCVCPDEADKLHKFVVDLESFSVEATNEVEAQELAEWLISMGQILTSVENITQLY